MTNKVGDGVILSYTNAGAAISSGGVVVIGGRIGIAVTDIAATTGVGPVALCGVYSKAKATGAVAVGQTVHWDAVALNFTTVGSGNVFAGYCTKAAASGDANVEFRLAENPYGGTTGFIPLPLMLFRETTNFDVGNIVANGGVLASDTTPILDAVNAATDGAQRLTWAASNNDQITCQFPVPIDMDLSKDVLVKFRIASGGTTNAVGFTVDSFWDEGDTKVVDTSETNQTTTVAEKTATIAAADMPDTAQTCTIGLTPVAHTTDVLAMTAAWIEYTKK